MGVDRSREHGQACGVDHLAAAAAGTGFGDVDDHAARNHDIARRIIDQTSADDQFCLHLTLPRRAVSGAFVSSQ